MAQVQSVQSTTKPNWNILGQMEVIASFNSFNKYKVQTYYVLEITI